MPLATPGVTNALNNWVNRRPTWPVGGQMGLYYPGTIRELSRNYPGFKDLSWELPRATSAFQEDICTGKKS